ncbi:hypothetical protein D3C87_1114990 [compost metagenome]
MRAAVSARPSAASAPVTPIAVRSARVARTRNMVTERGAGITMTRQAATPSQARMPMAKQAYASWGDGCRRWNHHAVARKAAPISAASSTALFSTRTGWRGSSERG